jgi:hypothetical protein
MAPRANWRRADRVSYVTDSPADNLSSRGNTSPAETVMMRRTRIAFPLVRPLCSGPGAARPGAFFGPRIRSIGATLNRQRAAL